MAKLLLHQLYAEQMNHHPYGYALYQPAYDVTVRPGVCGYFDRYGYWNPVVDLNKKEELEKHSLPELAGPLEAIQQETQEWGPKCSKTVTSRVLGASAGASATAAGLPVDVKAYYQFETKTDYGAVLITSSPVSYNRVYGYNIFKTWVDANVGTLLSKWPEIRDYGLWLVTSTISTPGCSLNATLGSQKKIRLGFKAAVTGAGEASSRNEWFQESFDSGWNHYGKSTLSTQIDDANKDAARNGKNKRRNKPKPKPPAPSDKLGDGSSVIAFVGGLYYERWVDPISRDEELRSRDQPGKSHVGEKILSALYVALFVLASIVSLGLVPCLYYWRRRFRSANEYGAAVWGTAPAAEVPDVDRVHDWQANVAHGSEDAEIDLSTNWGLQLRASLIPTSLNEFEQTSFVFNPWEPTPGSLGRLGPRQASFALPSLASNIPSHSPANLDEQRIHYPGTASLADEHFRSWEETEMVSMKNTQQLQRPNYRINARLKNGAIIPLQVSSIGLQPPHPSDEDTSSPLNPTVSYEVPPAHNRYQDST